MSRIVEVKNGRMMNGTPALAARPISAKLMLEVVATWSLVEHFIGMMFCCMLDGNEGEAFDIFHSFFDLGPRKRAFFVVAEKKLKDEELLTELRKFFDSLRNKMKMRNRIAHGLWGISDQFPSEMLLINGQTFNSRFMKSIRQAKHVKSFEELGTDRYDDMTVEAFTDQEFIDDAASLNNLSLQTLSFSQRMIPHVFRGTV